MLLTLSKDKALAKKLTSKWAELNILTTWWLFLLFLVTSLHKVFWFEFSRTLVRKVLVDPNILYVIMMKNAELLENNK